jgi:putative ATP-dependent endonuclease of OLD family
VPIQLKLSSGLNILVGPNDAGKSAISDAARYVLWTRGDDYVRPDEQDFHVDADGRRGRDFVVRCTFDGLSADEEARFLGASRRAGAASSPANIAPARRPRACRSTGELREYLKATYLKPLRDAERATGCDFLVVSNDNETIGRRGFLPMMRLGSC